MEYDYEKWIKDVSNLPIMYEVFIDSTRPEAEFFDRSLGFHLPIIHSPFTSSFFMEQ
jgi:hypothetical protein